MFYNEVVKDGRIYVFAKGQKYDTFQKSGGTEAGAVYTRTGYGPNGETVVFDSDDAVNLYNFKHGLPGEYFPPPPEGPKPSSYPSGKFSGLMFGDYYYFEKWHQNQVSSSNTNPVQDQHGFWFRRLYFTYDLAFSEKFTSRFRIEMNSNGQFAGGNLVPFVKDAYLRWNYRGKHQSTVGIQPSLTFDWFEAFWGMRHIEKTPADLYRIDSSRDFGLAFSGPVQKIQNVTYAAQFGNESGNGSETDRYKIARFEGRYEVNPGIAVEAFYSYGWRPKEQDRTTAQGIIGYRNSKFGRVGGQFLWQQRNSGVDSIDAQEIAIWSGFFVWDVKPKKADLFVRVDVVDGTRGDVDTGLPGADGIDYLLLSPRSNFTTVIVGGEWYLHPSIRVGPNLELVKYNDDPDPTNFPGRDQDRIYRLTFFWTF
jgi:hypothetical protein